MLAVPVLRWTSKPFSLSNLIEVVAKSVERFPSVRFIKACIAEVVEASVIAASVDGCTPNNTPLIGESVLPCVKKESVNILDEHHQAQRLLAQLPANSFYAVRYRRIQPLRNLRPSAVEINPFEPPHHSRPIRKPQSNHHRNRPNLPTWCYINNPRCLAGYIPHEDAAPSAIKI